MWLEYIQRAVAGTYDPSRNLAYGGAVVGDYVDNNLSSVGIKTLNEQISSDLIPAIKSGSSSAFGQRPLVTLWIGGNNYRQQMEDKSGLIFGNVPKDLNKADAQVRTVPSLLQTINDAFKANSSTSVTGATYYVLTVPDVSQTPKFSSADANDRNDLHSHIESTNYRLKEDLYNLGDQFASSPSQSRIVVVDAAALLNEVQANPQSFGFTEGRKNCYDDTANTGYLSANTRSAGGYVNGCSPRNVSQYLFWDAFHPTTKAHEMIAKYALNTDALEAGTQAQLDQPYVANIEVRDRTYAGKITGVGSMLKMGDRTLTLAGDNSYQGGTRLDDGTVRISQDNNLGAQAGALTFRGGTLNTTTTMTMQRDIITAPYKQAPDRIDDAGQDITRLVANFEVDQGTTLTLANNTFSGTGSVEKIGAGTLDIQSTVQDSRSLVDILDGTMLFDSKGTFRADRFQIFNGATMGGSGSVAGYVRNENGILRPGDQNGFGALTISGNYYQSRNGTLALNADFVNSKASELIATNADVRGKIDVTPITLAPTELPVIATTQSLSLSPDSITKTLAVAYGIKTVGDGRTANLYVAQADFTPAGVALNGDQQRAGDMLNELWAQNKVGDTDGALAKLATVMDPKTYAGLLEDFNTEGYGAAPVKQADSSAKFKTNLMSCPVFAGDGSLTVETECAWGRLYGSRTDRFADADDEGYRQTGGIMQVGAQRQIAANTFLGMSIGYEESSNRSRDGGSSSDGQGVSGGLALKRQLGPWLFAAALEGGSGWYRNTRSTGPLDGEVAHSDSRLDHVSGRLRAAYTFDFGPWYAKPYADLDLSYLHTPAFTEKDGGPLGLHVMGSNVFLATFIPTLEIGGRVNIGENWTARPYGSAGVSLVSDSNYAVRSVLTGAPLSDAYEKPDPHPQRAGQRQARGRRPGDPRPGGQGRDRRRLRPSIPLRNRHHPARISVLNRHGSFAEPDPEAASP
ncbi:autotransporter domain-containing protein [Hyphomicrobiales bacterium BP6-180914]|uniref:Autotransporter domain-containing protein n=1 Tax=Lichenifustis flavocetrariae TaxID=2949735 RepID=A0AA42CKN2_9HYPH|nr:autotransporter domain-containing protein [Lichenifustis flavocetrariae]